MTTINEIQRIVEHTRSLSNKKDKLEYLKSLDRDVLNFLSGNIKKDGIAKAIASEMIGTKYSVSTMEDVITTLENASNESSRKRKITYIQTLWLSKDDCDLVLTILYGSLKLGVTIPIPEPEFSQVIKCQLCGNIEFDPSNMIIETKWDGMRCLATNNNGEITLQSRNGKVLNVPIIARSLLDVLPSGCTVDGEIIDQSGDFQKLDRKSDTLIYQIFDIIFVGKKPIIDSLLKDRLIILEDTIKENEHVKISQPLNLNSIEEIDSWITETGAEGIVAKFHDEPYIYNGRKNFIKYKLFKECTAKVIGYNMGEGRRKNTIGAINIIPENSNVITKCGSGFNDSDLDYMKEIIDNGDDILVNIKFQNLTTDGCLRFPIFLEIRSINGKESLD